MKNDMRCFYAGNASPVSKMAFPLCLSFVLLSAPALAETEIEALKRELAEQKELIKQILEAQASQKAVNAKVGGASGGAGFHR